MKLTFFRLSGRVGHFLRAEAAASAITYPVPPRTTILGLMGAVLGIEKDQPQTLLEPAFIALEGKIPRTHWHKVKLRKDPPAPLPKLIKGNQKAEKITKQEKATLIWQEWLFNPSYTVWASVPEPYLTNMEQRLIEKRWHFQPCLGLSEMIAELEYLGTDKASLLPIGCYEVNSIVPQKDCTLKMDRVFRDNLVIRHLRMPRTVTPERVFSHESYFIERDGRSIPIETDRAFHCNGKNLLFL